MSTTLHVTVDPATGNLARAISTAAESGLLVILTARMFVNLAAELGGDDAAMRFLHDVSERVNRPLGCNFPTLDGSRTAFIAPDSWTQERLAGWVGARHEEIAEMFGPAVPKPLEDA